MAAPSSGGSGGGGSSSSGSGGKDDNDMRGDGTKKRGRAVRRLHRHYLYYHTLLMVCI